MKKRMILALVLVFALLCLACSNDADDGTSSSESVSVAETSTDASAESSSRSESTSSADGTSDETSTESDTSSETSTESETSGTTTSAESTSSDTSTGTESSATSSDASTSSKPTEGSENSKPTEGSENGGSVDTSSGSGNPSQTGHKHSYKTTVVKPTCTEDGYTLHECSCGDSYKDNEVPATGHEMGYWTVRNVKECSYSEPGIKERPCNRCGEWLVDNEYYHYWTPPVNDEEEVYRRIIALQEIYPQFSVWDGDTYYDARYDAWGNLIKQDDFEGWGVTDGYESADACMGYAAMVSNTVFGIFWGHRTLPKGTFTIEDVRVGDLIYFKNHVVVALEVYDDHIAYTDGNDAGMVNWYGVLNREYLESSCYIETRYDPECF